MIAGQPSLSCGINRALEILGGKWTLLIIRDLLDNPKRFCEIESSLEGISPRTLASRLKDLERDGILTRDCSSGPAHPLYRLSEYGRDLHAIISQMHDWGSNLPARALLPADR